MAGRGDTGQGYIDEIVDLANSGNTSGFTKADWKIIADNAGYTTPRAAAAAATAPGTPDDDGGGDTGPDITAETDAERAQRAYYEGLEADRIASNKANRESASSFLRGILSQYGMGSLADNVEDLVKNWGLTLKLLQRNFVKQMPTKPGLKV
jgi:hypothetical protein